MKNDDKQLISDLQLLGLTQNEAKVVIALIKLNCEATVPQITPLAGVPRTKIYEVLNGLQEKNFVNCTEFTGRTNLYQLTTASNQIIADLQKNLVQSINTAAARSADAISRLVPTSKDQSEEIGLIKGLSHIKRILSEKIDNADIEIISNAFPMFLVPILDPLIRARSRGIDIKLIMLDEEVAQLPETYRIQLSEHLSGISFKHLSQHLEFIPEEFKDILQLFQELLLTRPNVLMVDPDTPNAVAFLFLQSEADSTVINAIQVSNQDFIAFTIKLMNLIFRFAGAARLLLQTQSPPD